MTILEAIQKSAEYLERKGVDSPRLQAELLLAHIFNIPRLKLYLGFEQQLTQLQSDAFRNIVVQRGNRIPLQLLTGHTSFCGCPIYIYDGALIPRPETETLAEYAWQFLNTLQGETAFLELGAGTGCLSIAIAENAKQSHGIAIDISSTALNLARKNVEFNQLNRRLTLQEGDLFSSLAADQHFDLIVSNPPYIPSAEIDTLQPEVRDHDPRLALDGGADGLNFYRRIAAEAAAFLKPEGRLMLEFGDGQAPALRGIFENHGWKIISIIRDLTKRERVLIASR